MLKKTIILIAILLMVAPTFAGELKGVKMDDSITVAGKKLVLNGMALRKKYIFVKVYVMGLYIPTKEKSAEKILSADTERVGIMHWLHSAPPSKINDGWYEGLKKNTPGFSKELKKKFDVLAAYMESIKSGERIVFTYIPAKGTEVKVKGKIKGIIKGKDFADALFACWIGKDPGPGQSFKEDLLGID